MNNRISGKKIADKIREDLKKQISEMDTEIVFSIIYVGQDDVIDNFIKYKQKFGKEIGVKVIVHNFDNNVEQGVLISEIKNISKTSDAIIVQLPLPKHIDTIDVLNSIPAEKDVDVLSETAIDLFSRNKSEMFPPVTGAMVEVLKSKNYNLEDKNIVIFGYGNLVGKPFGAWLNRENISYNIIRSKTEEKEKNELLRNADLIVSGAGIPNIIKGNMISENVVLLDGGTSEAGKKIIGDIDVSCYSKALFYTPVPGGIGPLTIAVLYKNIISIKNNG
jgi:methylenetetrahydrofolate dehydrogenase (NADP+)/methenyltetrahydrofolate cyclohydrolase